MSALKFSAALFLIIVLMALSVVTQPKVTLLGFADIPIVFIILLAIFLGTVFAYFLGLPDMWRLKKKLLQKENELKDKISRIQRLDLKIRELEEKIEETDGLKEKK